MAFNFSFSRQIAPKYPSDINAVEGALGAFKTVTDIGRQKREDEIKDILTNLAVQKARNENELFFETLGIKKQGMLLEHNLQVQNAKLNEQAIRKGQLELDEREKMRDLDFDAFLNGPTSTPSTEEPNSNETKSSAASPGPTPVTYYSLGTKVGGPDESNDDYTNAGYSSTGKNLTPGMAAVNPSVYPIGSVLQDNDTGEIFISGDKHGNKNPNVVDIFKDPKDYRNAVKAQKSRNLSVIGKVDKVASTVEGVQEQLNSFRQKNKDKSESEKPDTSWGPSDVPDTLSPIGEPAVKEVNPIQKLRDEMTDINEKLVQYHDFISKQKISPENKARLIGAARARAQDFLAIKSSALGDQVVSDFGKLPSEYKDIFTQYKETTGRPNDEVMDLVQEKMTSDKDVMDMTAHGVTLPDSVFKQNSAGDPVLDKRKFAVLKGAAVQQKGEADRFATRLETLAKLIDSDRQILKDANLGQEERNEVIARVMKHGRDMDYLSRGQDPEKAGRLDKLSQVSKEVDQLLKYRETGLDYQGAPLDPDKGWSAERQLAELPKYFPEALVVSDKVGDLKKALASIGTDYPEGAPIFIKDSKTGALKSVFRNKVEFSQWVNAPSPDTSSVRGTKVNKDNRYVLQNPEFKALLDAEAKGGSSSAVEASIAEMRKQIGEIEEVIALIDRSEEKGTPRMENNRAALLRERARLFYEIKNPSLQSSTLQSPTLRNK